MTGFPIVILVGFGNEVKNLTAHSRLFLRKSIKLASYLEEKCSSRNRLDVLTILERINSGTVLAPELHPRGTL